jgi:hypothetical protein
MQIMLRLPHGVSKRHMRGVAFRMRIFKWSGLHWDCSAISGWIDRQEYWVAGTKDAKP